MLWFDPIGGLNDDNTCAGCHSPTNGFGDTQSIAIGIDNNGVVGRDRTGPRNQRRSPMVLNTAFYPTLMWNSRFRALSGDPFDNSVGLQFPDPEGLSLSYERHLLAAQAFIPPTERVEVAGFTFPGGNDDIRNEVLRRLNATRNYRELFSRAFPDVKAGRPITFDHVGRAVAEFEFTLVAADAPIDRYARGDRNAMVSEPRPITALRSPVPAPVCAALERALAKNPADRFSLVSQFADALGPPESTPVSAAALPTVSPPTGGRPPRAERVLLMIGVVLAVVLVLVVTFVVWQRLSR